jgi:hypothetical protein
MTTKTGRLFIALLPLLIGLGYTFANPTPTPEPFDINKVDFSKITQEDIDKTIEHRKQLDRQGATINEKQAVLIDTQAIALAAATKATSELQGEIKDLAKHDQEMTNKVLDQQTDLAKKDLAILRAWVFIGGLLLAIGSYLVAKFYFHLPI